MSTIIEQDRPTTLSDIVSRLGDIPLERIRWDPRPGTATEEDVVRAESCELIDGVLVEKAMGFPEGRIGQVLACYLELWVSRHELGVVVGQEPFTRMKSRNVRIPDVYFVRWERLPSREVPQDAITNYPPHLAVEVFSRGNTEGEMQRKRNEFFESGTDQVWIVRPTTQTIDVWTSTETFTTLGLDDVLDAGDVVPGFRLSVREVFEAGRRGMIDTNLALAMLQGEPGHDGSGEEAHMKPIDRTVPPSMQNAAAEPSGVPGSAAD